MATATSLLPTSAGPTISTETVELPDAGNERRSRCRRVGLGGALLTIGALMVKAVLAHQLAHPSQQAAPATAALASFGSSATTPTATTANWCSAQQIAEIKRCNSHCGRCSDAEVDSMLADCIVVHPFGHAIIDGSAMVLEICSDADASEALAAVANPIQREALTVGVTTGPTGAYSYLFGASSFGKPVTLTLNFISADKFTMRVDAPVQSMSKYCPSESYSYTAANGLQVTGYESDGDCIHDALGVVHIHIKSFSYDKGADTIDLSYRLLFRSHTITLKKAQ